MRGKACSCIFLGVAVLLQVAVPVTAVPEIKLCFYPNLAIPYLGGTDAVSSGSTGSDSPNPRGL